MTRTSNSLKEDVRRHNKAYIPQEGDICRLGGVLEVALEERQRLQDLRNTACEYTYVEIGDGNAYLRNLIDTRELWKGNYIVAKGLCIY